MDTTQYDSLSVGPTSQKNAAHDPLVKEAERKVAADITQQEENSSVKEPQDSDQELQESVKKIESVSQIQSKLFEFSIHEESNKSYVVVRDANTDEIIRQIPSEEVLEIASKIDKIQEEIFGSSLGLLFDQKI